MSDVVKGHVMSLSASDAVLEAALKCFFEVVRVADADYPDGPFSELFRGPSQELNRYYATLGTLYLIAIGCPEERQTPLVGTVGAWLFGARWLADGIFGRELSGCVRTSESFEWSAQPGPHEVKLQLRQGNPLFPAAMRSVGAAEVTDARRADLALIIDFVRQYTALMREPFPGNVRDASAYEKRLIDLMAPCVVVGDYFSEELKSLEGLSGRLGENIARATEEPRLRDFHARVTALTRISGALQKLTTGFPSGEGLDDLMLASVLSQELSQIAVDAQLLGATSWRKEDSPRDAERIVNAAIRTGLEPGLGQRKLDAFRRGFADGRRVVRETEPRPGFLTGLKGFVRRFAGK